MEAERRDDGVLRVLWDMREKGLLIELSADDLFDCKRAGGGMSIHAGFRAPRKIVEPDPPSNAESGSR